MSLLEHAPTQEQEPTTAVQTKTPIEKMQQSFSCSVKKRNGWWTHPDAPTFDWREREDGSIEIHSWTGRTVHDILAMGHPPLKMSDLSSHSTQSKSRFGTKSESLDLLALSHYLLIPWQFLHALGYTDGYHYRNEKSGRLYKCVKLGGYCYPDGSEYDKIKVRLSIDPRSKFRFAWDENTPGETIPCGLHTLDKARGQGYLIIGEGESDWVTMMFHNMPFLGISGAGAVKRLDVSLLQDIPVVYILEEPDQVKKNRESGKGFYADVRAHLRENGYTGKIFAIPFKRHTNCKDPNELHKFIYYKCKLADEVVHAQQVKSMFREAMQQAFEKAVPEGNDELGNQEREPYKESPPPLPQTSGEREQWIYNLCALPSSILSPSAKISLIVLMRNTQWFGHKPGIEYGRFHVEAGQLCDQAGMSKETFLSNLSYATKRLGLFKKKAEKEFYVIDEKKKTKVKTRLYITPSDEVWMRYPSTWSLKDGKPERKQGGLQKPKQRPECPQPEPCLNCQSVNVEHYEAVKCLDCGYVHYEEKQMPPVDIYRGMRMPPMQENHKAAEEQEVQEEEELPIAFHDEPFDPDTLSQPCSYSDNLPPLDRYKSSFTTGQVAQVEVGTKQEEAHFENDEGDTSSLAAQEAFEKREKIEEEVAFKNDEGEEQSSIVLHDESIDPAVSQSLFYVGKLPPLTLSSNSYMGQVASVETGTRQDEQEAPFHPQEALAHEIPVGQVDVPVNGTSTQVEQEPETQEESEDALPDPKELAKALKKLYRVHYFERRECEQCGGHFFQKALTEWECCRCTEYPQLPDKYMKQLVLLYPKRNKQKPSFEPLNAVDSVLVEPAEAKVPDETISTTVTTPPTAVIDFDDGTTKEITLDPTPQWAREEPCSRCNRSGDLRIGKRTRHGNWMCFCFWDIKEKLEHV